MNQPTSPTVPTTRPGRGMLWLGILTALGGVAAYAVQFQSGRLTTPWYMPIMAALGVIMILASLLEKQSLWRWAALLLFGAFAGFQWFAFLVMMKLPAYAGPAKVGDAFPAFATNLADGSAYSQENLKSDKNTIMVFFRGRW